MKQQGILTTPNILRFAFDPTTLASYEEVLAILMALNMPGQCVMSITTATLSRRNLV